MSKEVTKRFTAKEIGEMAKRFGRLASNPSCLSVQRPKDSTGRDWAYDGEAESTVQKMLEQASKDLLKSECEKKTAKGGSGKTFTMNELEVAKAWFDLDRNGENEEEIASVCIGIVMEMLKTKESTITDYEWLVGKTQGNITAKTAGGKIIIAQGVSSLTRPHIVGLHEIWRKAVAAFRGNGK